MTNMDDAEDGRQQRLLLLLLFLMTTMATEAASLSTHVLGQVTEEQVKIAAGNNSSIRRSLLFPDMIPPLVSDSLSIDTCSSA